MTTQIEKNEKAEVTEYFNGTGFDRWNRLYSESDDVNKVQKNIRIGHQKTVDDVMSWLKAVSYTHLTLPTILRV